MSYARVTYTRDKIIATAIARAALFLSLSTMDAGNDRVEDLSDDVVYTVNEMGRTALPEDDGWTISLRSIVLCFMGIAPNLDAMNRGMPGRLEKKRPWHDGLQKRRECDGFKAE